MWFEKDSTRFISYSGGCLRNMGCGTSTRVYFLFLCVAPLAEGRRESCSTRRRSANRRLFVTCIRRLFRFEFLNHEDFHRLSISKSTAMEVRSLPLQGQVQAGPRRPHAPLPLRRLGLAACTWAADRRLAGATGRAHPLHPSIHSV